MEILLHITSKSHKLLASIEISLIIFILTNVITIISYIFLVSFLTLSFHRLLRFAKIVLNLLVVARFFNGYDFTDIIDSQYLLLFLTL